MDFWLRGICVLGVLVYKVFFFIFLLFLFIYLFFMLN